MSMMLLAIFAAASVGAFARGFGRRETALYVLIGVALTMVYFFRPRFMT